MRYSATISAFALSFGLSMSAFAVDSVIVDASGNMAVLGQVTAPNVLQGAAGVSVIGGVTLTASAFGSWHWISGTTADYTVTLPTAVSNAGKSIGLRVQSGTTATKLYTIAAVSGQTIDGDPSLVLEANNTVILMSDGAGWARIGGLTSDGANPGDIKYVCSTTPPPGWLKANGSLVSRVTYARLFARIGTTFGAGDGSTTFKLPDLRGEFVRGLDDGRSVDTGRVLGTAQSDMFKAHTHGVGDGGDSTSQSSYSSVRGVGNDTTITSGSTGGTETRPRNVALLAVIKY